MAAKKKSDSSEDNKKTSKSKAKTGKKAPAKKPAKKKEELPEEPIVTNDDDLLGLDDIDLDLADDPVLEEPTRDEDNEETLIAVPEIIPEPEPVSEPEPEPEPEPTPAPVVVEEKKETSPKPVTPPKKEEEERKNRGAIWIIIIVILLALVAVYFLVIKPGQSQESEPVKQAPIEQKQPDPEPEPVKQPDPKPEPPKEAKVTTISEQGSRFYVVVGSFIDSDGAEDKAKSIVASGTDAYIIEPLGGTLYYRVGIKPSANAAEANAAVDGLKATYGEQIWVLKH